MRILFVCSGNTCRSPMAQAIMDNMPESMRFGIISDSAGLYVDDDSKMSEKALWVLKENFGIENFCHSPKPITMQLIEDADLIVCMSFAHKCIIDNAFGEYEKTVSMPEDIPDPFGSETDEYSKCSLLIAEGLRKLIKKGIIHA